MQVKAVDATRQWDREQQLVSASVEHVPQETITKRHLGLRNLPRLALHACLRRGLAIN